MKRALMVLVLATGLLRIPHAAGAEVAQPIADEPGVATAAEPRPGAVAGTDAGPVPDVAPDPEPGPSPDADSGEVLWRQVTLENGNVVLVRDRLVIGESVSVVRDAFVIRRGEVLNRLPLDAEGQPIEQIVLQLKVQPLSGLRIAKPGDVMTAIAWLERPRPDPSTMPETVLAQGPDPMLRWQRVDMSSGRTMVFWDRVSPGGSVVRDAFLVERQAVARHLVVDAAADPVAFTSSFTLSAETVGALEPATESNVLVVADYLDDGAPTPTGVLESDFSLDSFKPGSDSGGGVVSPSGGIGGP